MKGRTNYFRNLLAQFKIVYLPISFINELIFYLRIRKYKNVKKIIYTVTPTPALRNVGDHAQVIAIRKWFENNFKDYLVLEFDKDEIYKYISIIKKIVNEKDLVFLQSGGNLGDRGLWSEKARRLVIENFSKNKVISLPQTIFFSDTKEGKEELEATKSIYNNHNDLIIIARDNCSFRLAKDYFPKCKIMVCPDFVLYLQPYNNIGLNGKRENVLLCLREDTESIISGDARDAIKEFIKNLNMDCSLYNTFIDRCISRENREREFKSTLSLFKKHKLVITDRLHGVLFSVITRTPCIALKTIDHKVTESMNWFVGLNYVSYTEDYKQLPEMIERMMRIENVDNIDWRALYFDNLKQRIQSNES